MFLPVDIEINFLNLVSYDRIRTEYFWDNSILAPNCLNSRFFIQVTSAYDQIGLKICTKNNYKHQFIYINLI